MREIVPLYGPVMPVARAACTRTGRTDGTLRVCGDVPDIGDLTYTLPAGSRAGPGSAGNGAFHPTPYGRHRLGNDMGSIDSEEGTSWREILVREHVLKILVLALGVWLHATNSMLTATTMPSAAQEVGGLNLISWTFALYLVGSIIAGASSSLLVMRNGLRNTMVGSALVYALGCAVCALAPSMPVILVGRMLQGLGGGCLVATVYVSQDRFFPNRFVPRIVACLSVVWMTATLCGPTIGGAFSTWGVWRYAYWAFAGQAFLFVIAVRTLLGPTDVRPQTRADAIPVVRLSLLAAAILMISVAGARFDPVLSPIMVGLGILFLFVFVHRDWRASSGRMLPREIRDFSRPLANGVSMVLLLSLCIMSLIVYGPLILIEVHGFTPFSAGLVVMLESLAWGAAALVFSGSQRGREPLLVRCGSALVLAGLVLTALVLPGGPLWALVIVVQISGGGFGMMWGFVIRRIIGAARKDEKDRAAALIPFTQQIGFALGAALSGLIANGLGVAESAPVESLKTAAFWLFAGFVPCALCGNVVAWRFVRKHLPAGMAVRRS